MLDSIPGEGSCFKVLLPAELISSSQSARPLQKLDISNLSIPSKLLVIEDNPDILQLLRIVLENVDCIVLVSADGIDGVAKCLAEQPDLVLMDLNLPTISGYEATRKLRAAGFSKPIFALSASTSADHKQCALNAGCDEYVLKPFDIPHLLILIQQFIKQSTSQGMPKRRHNELNERFEASLDDKIKRLDQLLIVLRSEQYSHDGILKLRQFIHNLAGSAGLYGHYRISETAKQIDDLFYDNLLSNAAINPELTEVLESKSGDLRALLMAAAENNPLI
jgi:DNA-binding response OmpR family regulator